MNRDDIDAAFEAGKASTLADTCPYEGGLLAAAWRDGRRLTMAARREQMLASVQPQSA